MEQPSLALEAPFVDREKELMTLKTLFEQTLAGKGSTVFVVGEAGIGKTRLVRELRRYVESKDAIFSAASSYEEEGVVPYSPWIDVIKSTFRKIPSGDLRKMPEWIVAEVGRLIPDFLSEAKEMGLKAWLQGPSPASTIMPATDQDRIRLFQAITEFLISVARDHGLVVFFDDVSWADHVSLQLFHYVARRVADQKLMLIGAYREVELPDEHPLAKLTLDLSRQRTAHTVSLSRFTQEHVEQLLSTHLNGPVSVDLSRVIYSRTGGNPFFVEEIVRSLMDQRLLRKSSAGWAVSDIEHVEIPTSVRAVIKQRMSRLGEECSQLLSMASVLGMEFDFEILKKVSGLPEERSLSLLESALKAQIVRERREEDRVFYEFADEQIRDYLASQVSLLRRRKYHLAIGRAIEELYESQIEKHLDELAYHFVQAGEVTKAKEYSTKAGERSAALYAHYEAMKHFMNALELLSESDTEVRLQLLTKLGHGAWSRADYKDVLRFCGEAIDVAERLGSKTRLAELYGLMGMSHWQLGNSKRDALDSLLKGLRVLEDMKDTPQEAVLCQQMARIYILTGEPAIGTGWATKAIEIASKIGAQEVLAHAYQSLAQSLPYKQKESILRYLEVALNLALDQKLHDPAVRAFINLGATYSDLKGDYKLAEDFFLRGIDYAKKTGNLHYETWLRGELVEKVYLPTGKWERCQRAALETTSLGKELGELFIIYPYIALGFIAIARGEVDRAKEFLNEAIHRDLKSEWPQFIVPSYRLVAAIHLTQNEFDEAEENLLKAFEYSRKAGAILNPWPEIGFELASLSISKGRLDKASDYYQQLLQIASELDERWAGALERWAKGLIAEAQGDTEEATKSLAESVEIWRTIERPYELARAQTDLARLLRKVGLNSEADKNFEDATKLFDRLGIPGPKPYKFTHIPS